MQKYWKVGIGGFIVVAAFFAQYWIMYMKKIQGSIADTAPVLASTTIPTPAINDPSGRGYAVKQLPLPKEDRSVPHMPNLEAFITGIIPANDYEKIVYGNLTKSVAALKVDTADYNAWLTIGMSLKQLERFTAARDVFLYITMEWPTEAVAYANLGSLYHLYLKDFPHAEAAYQKAITLDPHQPAWHRGLYELYRYSYKIDTNAWEETLKRGIAQTNSIDLMTVLANRYVDLKRFPESITVYDRAIAEAEKQGNTKLMNTLTGYRTAAQAEVK